MDDLCFFLRVINYIYRDMVCVLLGLLLGFCLNILVNSKVKGCVSVSDGTKRIGLRKGLKKGIRKLDNIVLLFSFIGAAFCLFINLFLGKENVSIQLLSFYTSFIFAWLLTKKSSKEEFENTQHKVAKNTYRHIEDVETAALVTRDRLRAIMDKQEYSVEDLEGIIDNVEIILTGIRSNKKDWMEMLKPSYVRKIKKDEDPEARLLHSKEKIMKGESQRKSAVSQPEDLSGLSNALGNMQDQNNRNA